MRVVCPRCGASKTLPGDTLGRRIHCKQCGALFRYAVEFAEPPPVAGLPTRVVEDLGRSVAPVPERTPVEAPPIIVVRPEHGRPRSSGKSAVHRRRDTHRAGVNVAVTYVGLGLATLPILGGLALSIESGARASELLCVMSLAALGALPFLALAMWGGKR